MEKICIVKKRKQPVRQNNNGTLTEQSSDDIIQRNHDRKLNTSYLGGFSEMPDIDDVSLKGANNNVISLKLTPQQCSYLLSSNFKDHLPEEITQKFVIDAQKTNGVNIFFNFHLRKPESIRLLKMNQVCQMLQVSRSYLMNLVRSKKIKCYKMGGMRRFSLDDVLIFLTESEDIPMNHSMKNDV